MKAIATLMLLGLALFSHAQQRPNIVIIVSDDHSYQAISAYGSKLMNTPNIDRIAREGAIFNKAYVTNSLCGPSRAVLLTGTYNHKNGFKDNVRSTFDPAQDMFVKHLQATGYQTAWIGKYHLGEKVEGFDFWKLLPGQGSYYNPDFILMDGTRKRTEGYVTDVVEDAAEEWLDGRDKSKPFCLVIGQKATHRTWMPDTTDLGKFDNRTFPLPPNFYDDYKTREAASLQDMSVAKTMRIDYDLKMQIGVAKDFSILRMNPAQRKRYTSYYAAVEADFKSKNLSGNALVEWKYQRYMRDYMSTATSLDRNIGRTLAYLDKNNLTKNTVVIYLSDQGFYMGEHGWFDKRFMYEESFRTPMVMRFPGVIRPGTRVDGFVMNLDIAPTMLDVAGLKIPAGFQGRSIMPLLVKGAAGRTAMYYHYYENGEHSVSPHFGIRTRRYKLIRFYEKVNGWELFDLQTDPSEMKNIYGTKGLEQLTADLKKQLKALVEQYEDTEASAILATN